MDTKLHHLMTFLIYNDDGHLLQLQLHAINISAIFTDDHHFEL